jgi:hypothetical protein
MSTAKAINLSTAEAIPPIALSQLVAAAGTERLTLVEALAHAENTDW